MTPPTILYVAWQATSRRILSVGRLLRTADGYEFAYILRSGRLKRFAFCRS